jgi:AraC-like DNA-binding protein
MEAPEPTISSMAARAVVFAAAQHGVAPPDLCKQVGLDPVLLADNDGRIPASVMIALWEAVSPLDPDFGLHLAELSLSMGTALPWHLVRASSTLAEGILRLVAAWRVFNDIHPPELTLPGEHGVLRMRSKNTPLPIPRHAAEYAFAWFVIAARRATGIDVQPTRVTFEHPEPASTSEHARIFGTQCEVAFDDDGSSIVIAADVLALPTREADPDLVQILEKHAEALLAKLPQRGGFAARVRSAMTPLLACGDVTIDRVAAALASSTRSVQRRLHDENTSFQRVLDELRREVATEYLGDRAKSIAEVALLLGFSDQTAFHRAFVRWTGRTPGDVRRGSMR